MTTSLPSLPFDKSWMVSPPDLQVYFSRCSTPTTLEIPPLLFCIHGANHSSSSFALLSTYLKEVCDILTLDLRGHGRSSKVENTTDISLSTLVNDCFCVLDHYLSSVSPSDSRATTDNMNTSSSSSSSIPQTISSISTTGQAISESTSTVSNVSVILIGHSLGASIVTELSSRWSSHYSGNPPTHTVPHLKGLVMIDFTEGGALASLQLMEKITHQLATQNFRSHQEAIEWSLHSHMLRLRTSAELSIPFCLEPVQSTTTVTHLDSGSLSNVTSSSPTSSSLSASPSVSHLSYKWRASEFLNVSPRYWMDWFTGSTDRFLTSSCPRLLFVSSMDRLSLDSALMGGQVSGKYQLSVIPGTGHVMHEDAPDKLALVLRAFLSRNHLSTEIENILLEKKLHPIHERKQQQSPSSSSSPGKGSTVSSLFSPSH